MKSQRKFFDDLVLRFKSRTELFQVLADKMHVSTETISKWSYGKTSLSYDRLVQIKHLFDLKPSDLFLSSPRYLSFDHMMFDMNDIADYQHYMSEFADRLSRAAEAPDACIYFLADDIPIFHFMPYTRLTYFKLYTYAYDRLKIDISFEEFENQLEVYNLEPLFMQIAESYEQIPSMEIWDDQVLDAILFHIEHFNILERYQHPETKNALLDDLSQLLGDFRVVSTNGLKKTGKRFDFFRIPTPIRAGYMLLQAHDKKTLTMKIDTINSISTFNTDFVETYWRSFKASIDKSTALGIGAERDRTLYFKNLMRKIEEAKTNPSSF